MHGVGFPAPSQLVVEQYMHGVGFPALLQVSWLWSSTCTGWVSLLRSKSVVEQYMHGVGFPAPSRLVVERYMHGVGFPAPSQLGQSGDYQQVNFSINKTILYFHLQDLSVL